MSDTNHTHGDAVRAKLTRNAFFILCLLLSLIVLGQLYTFNRALGSDRTLLKSQFIPDSCTAWVNDFETSKCYLESIALGDAAIMFSISPSNGGLVQKRMVARTHSIYQAQMKKWVYEQVNSIREQGYAFAFYPSEVTADTKTHQVYVTGTLNTRISTTPLAPETITWAFKYTIVNGEPLISGFSEYIAPHKRKSS